MFSALRLLPVSLGLALHQALPGSEFRMVRGAGLNPRWDRAEAFDRPVKTFLEGDKNATRANPGSPGPDEKYNLR